MLNRITRLNCVHLHYLKALSGLETSAQLWDQAAEGFLPYGEGLGSFWGSGQVLQDGQQLAGDPAGSLLLPPGQRMIGEKGLESQGCKSVLEIPSPSNFFLFPCQLDAGFVFPGCGANQ